VKALTICQPYAHLIAIGEKTVENRTWPASYRGRLAIHAGKSRAWLDVDDERQYPGMPFGAIVAIATLRACVRLGEIAEPWASNTEHVNGPWCWCLGDVERLKTPVPCRGAQGLFDVPADVLTRVLEVQTFGREVTP
jgi:hypothetical protein